MAPTRARASAAAFAVLLALTVIVPASAATKVLTDPAGDAALRAPAFLDIVRVAVAEDSGTFDFQMTLAGALPAAPAFPPGHGALWWNFALDLDPATAPAGSPNAPGVAQAGLAEFVVIVSWEDTAFSASLWDRRPLLSGGEVVVTPLALAISGADIRVPVDGDRLGDPSAFAFSAVTVAASSSPGRSDGRHVVDHLTPSYNPWP